MKKRIFALLTAGMLLLTGCNASGSKNEEPLQTMIVYQALPLPEIYMEIPERFETTSSEFYEKYYICEDASIIVTEDKNGPFSSAYDYSITALVQYKEVTHSLDVISEDVFSAKNCDVQLLEFNYTLGEDDAVKKTTMIGFISDGDSMYLITCKSDTDTYESYRNDFMSVMKSVMLTKTGK